jgi:hypothetical protein
MPDDAGVYTWAFMFAVSLRVLCLITLVRMQATPRMVGWMPSSDR